MQKLHTGEIKLKMTLPPTGEATHVMTKEFPPEEAMESLSARVRPVISESERIYWAKVLKAIEALVPQHLLEEVADPMSWWRAQWGRVVDRSPDAAAQAYAVVTEQGTATDRALMNAWMYGDLVHAYDLEAEAMGLSIDERYRAAAGVVARVVSMVELTFFLVRALVDAGHLQIDLDVFDRPVVVDEPNLHKEGRVLTALPGTEVPDDLENLNPAVWAPLHNVVHPRTQAPRAQPAGPDSPPLTPSNWLES